MTSGLRVLTLCQTVNNNHKRLLSEKVVGGQLETAKVDIGRAVTVKVRLTVMLCYGVRVRLTVMLCYFTLC